MKTFVASGRDKKPPRSHLVCFVVALFCLLSTSCGHEILQDTKSEERLSSARLSGEPVFSTTYEVEEYTATQILSKFSPDSKNRAFEEIAAQPRLDRQRIEFKLFADGNYELITTQVKPSKLDLLPASIRNRKTESVLAHKTVLRDGVAHCYDINGNETGKFEIKNNRYSVLAEKILKSDHINKNQIASEIMGHPLIDEAYIVGQATEKQAEIQQDRGVTKIKYDLSKFSAESNESEENLSKYAVQYYDFKNRRLVGETLWDKKSNVLLYQSTIVYSAIEKGNHVEQILSETYDQNANTGVKTKLLKQTFYSNVNTNVNRR